MNLNLTHKEALNLRILKMAKTLTHTEAIILSLLIEGSSYKEIATRLQTNDSSVHTHTSHIRQKTGIKDTRNPRECARILGRLENKGEIKPTLAQMGVLSLLATGKSYNQIATALKISPQTAQNHASQACKRVGLATLTREGLSRGAAIRAYLERLEAGEGKQPACLMDDPMF